jgi:hypothetical protein
VPPSVANAAGVSTLRARNRDRPGWHRRAGAGATCASIQKTSRKAAVTAYVKAMRKARAVYFKTHGSASARSEFVKRQQKRLATLRAAAACTAGSAGSGIGSGGSLPNPLPAPAPTANEQFTFEDAVASADRQTVIDDVAYAAADEQALTGVSYGEINVFVGTTADCLAQQDCGFASGAVEGGYQAIFIMLWPAGQGATETQKVIAHELFHVFQYETANLPNDQTPSSGVRILGPVWLHEGAAEMMGYHVAGDRHLGYTTYPALLETEKSKAKASVNAPPIHELLSVDQDRAAGNPYALYMVAVGRLVSTAPGGIPALAAYYRDIAAGQAWPVAFQSAFGMTVDASTRTSPRTAQGSRTACCLLRPPARPGLPAFA